MKKLSDKIRPDGHEGDAPRHGAFRHPEVSNRLSGMVTRALRLLPSVTVVLVLVTLVLYAAIGPGRGVPVLTPEPHPGSVQQAPSAGSYEPDLDQYDAFHRGDYWDTWYLGDPAATAAATQAPTAVPTLEPTPTSMPTATPTSMPTAAPTQVPLEIDSSGIVQEPLSAEDFEPDDHTVYVKAFHANIRSQPRTDAEIIAAAVMGDRLTRTGIGRYWAQVKNADGETGYVYSDLISESYISKPAPAATATPTPKPEPTSRPEPTAKPEPTGSPLETDRNGVVQEPLDPADFKSDDSTVYIKSSKANIRALPRTDTSILYTAVLGDALNRTGIGQYWSQVKNADGKVGYVYNDLISTTEVKPQPTAAPTEAPSNDTSSGLTAAQKQAIVDLAKSTLGTKYVYGAESPGGFDCSGLTTYIYKELFNITLPRSAKDQARAGTKVSSSNIQIGDILCFDWSSPYGVCDHVGIYIGSGEYIHASYTAGKVKQSTVNFSRNPIISIRRIIP